MKKVTKLTYQERILQVCLYIQNHLDEELSLEKLASIAFFSPYHFHRIFRGMLGESLSEYIRRLRLERAASTLRRSKESITNIAFDARYETVESFIRAFRDRFHSSPSEYRKKNAYANDLSSPWLKNLSFRGEKNMNVVVKHLPNRKVAFVRHLGPYKNCKHAWEKLCSWAGPKGLLTQETCFLGLCHDDPEVTAEEKIRYDACISIKNRIETSGEVGIQEIPEGEFATTIHSGSMENLKDTYAKFCGEWLPSSNRELSNFPSIEIYLNDPEKVAEKDLLIEVQMLLQKNI